MSGGAVQVGEWAKIVGVEHSPPETQRHRAELVGCLALVTGAAPGDSFAYVRLSEAVLDGRAGTPRRRWLVAWEDLTYEAEPVKLVPLELGYQLGAQGSGRGRVSHAVEYGSREGAERAVAVCGSGVKPLFIDDWPLPFSADDQYACAACVAVYRRG
ncbi:hypothetical protein ACIBKY_28575 [Nonomuraea sp. NPDC050394]|uniref:hypothetical protein n=1 Tax=Nonomuraea sp. NPDC050394 TaxID=3364363 RepID=UPI00379D2E9B